MSRVAVAAAVAVVAATLVDDVFADGPLTHARPAAVFVVAGLVAAALLLLAPRVRSLPVALGAGIAAGGALATLVSGLAWGGGVPDPLVGGGFAFNLADLAIAAGDALLIGGALFHGWRNRAQLRRPV